MKIIVLGADGLLGHHLCRELSPIHDVLGTVRGARPAPGWEQLCPGARWQGGCDAAAPESLWALLESERPAAVVNCLGLIKHREEARSAIASVRINALFPHVLAERCRAGGIRLAHISTDCVFSGARGGYSERDLADPADLYGRSKLTGEPEGPGCLTLRTTFVGWELKGRLGLLEWFASRRHEKAVPGFRRAVFSGPTAGELARLLGLILERSELEGLYHVGGPAIDKHAFLSGLREALGWNVALVADDAFHCDRSLDGSALQAALGWRPATWSERWAELAANWPLYEAMR